MRMQRGVKLGTYSDAKGVKEWPYFRDDVGLNRTESETTKLWDTECGKVGSIARRAEQACCSPDAPLMDVSHRHSRVAWGRWG